MPFFLFVFSGIFINRKYYYLRFDRSEAQFDPDSRFVVGSYCLHFLFVLSLCFFPSSQFSSFIFCSIGCYLDVFYPYNSVLANHSNLSLCFSGGKFLSYFWFSFLLLLLLNMNSFSCLFQMIKFIQSTQFINNDLRMYHAESNTPALARTSNLNEELGQVEICLAYCVSFPRPRAWKWFS